MHSQRDQLVELLRVAASRVDASLLDENPSTTEEYGDASPAAASAEQRTRKTHLKIGASDAYGHAASGAIVLAISTGRIKRAINYVRRMRDSDIWRLEASVVDALCGLGMSTCALRNSLLPPQTGNPRKTLVLDIDNTLIEASRCLSFHDEVVRMDVCSEPIAVYKRPHLDEFMARMSALYEIVLFTAGTQAYAEAIRAVIDKKKVVSHVLGREYMWSSYPSCVDSLWTAKRLDELGRPMAHCIIVDDNAFVCRYNLENTIVCSPFLATSPSTDCELLRIAAFLERAAIVSDVRDVCKTYLSSDEQDPASLGGARDVSTKRHRVE
jgi:Dullard-like phosphatase family protein